MGKYKSKVCPYCKTAFNDGDDIVVCNSCGMPHHRECWIENQGCTTFGCRGTINNTVSENDVTPPVSETSNYEQPKPAASQPSAFVFCTKCGEKISAQAAFCTRCGNPVGKATTPPPQQNYNPQYQPPMQNGYNNTQYNQSYQPNRPSYSLGVVDRDVAVFVDTNLEYYIPRFNRFKMQNTKASWNWVAFLFAPYWFIYRKMYAYAIAMIVAVFLLGVFAVNALGLVLLGGYIAIGIFANYIYMRWAEKAVSRAKGMAEPYRMQYLRTQGGVSPTALTIAIVGYFVLCMLIGLV